MVPSFSNVQTASEAAEVVANLMANELGHDTEWKEEQVNTFRALADQYLLN